MDKLRPISGKAAVELVRLVFQSAYNTFRQKLNDINLHDSADTTFDAIRKQLLDVSDRSLVEVAAPAYAYALVIVSVGLAAQASHDELAIALASNRTFEVAKGAQSVLGALATIAPDKRKGVFAAWRSKGRALLTNNDNVRLAVDMWLEEQALADPFRKTAQRLETHHLHSPVSKSNKIPRFRRYE